MTSVVEAILKTSHEMNEPDTRTVRHYGSLRLPFHIFLSFKRLCFFFETIYLSILYHMHNLYYNCNLLGIRRTFCSRKEKAKSNVNTTNVNIKYTCFLYFLSWRKENTVITKKRNLKLSSILFTLLFFSPRNYILLIPIFRFEQ